MVVRTLHHSGTFAEYDAEVRGDDAVVVAVANTDGDTADRTISPVIDSKEDWDDFANDLAAARKKEEEEVVENDEVVVADDVANVPSLEPRTTAVVVLVLDDMVPPPRPSSSVRSSFHPRKCSWRRCC